MNSSTENFITLEESTNNTEHFSWSLGSVEISAFTVFILFGLPTHCYIIWFIITGTGVASEFFNLSLSVCELSYCLCCLLILLSLLSQSLIKTTQYFLGLGITGRPLFYCLLCVERYLAVVHPVTFLKYKPLRYRVICCAVGWIITICSCFICMFIFGLKNYVAFSWLLSGLFLMFFSIQLFCLVAVLRALKQSGPGERKREKDIENHMKRRAFYLILITIVNMTFMFVPLMLSEFLIISTPKEVQKQRSFGLTCFVLCGFVYPALFLHRTGKAFSPLLKVKWVLCCLLNQN